jgi:hypothetical protein
MLSDPSSLQYTSEVHEVMQSSIPLLKKLLNSPETQSSETVPAKKWLESKKKNIRKSLVPFAGDLTFPERAKIANWFEKHVADQDPKRQKEWLGLLPIAHAHTIYIASQLKVDCSGAVEEAGELEISIQRAWQKQMGTSPSPWSEVDVDLRCLERLEEQMFERSALAGIAGNYQWGLDNGDHQACWDPYAGLPNHWNHGDRESESKGELQVSARLSCISETQT